MLEVGWSEILVIAIILILVVGPKELPSMLRTFGRAMTKLRSMANEFRGQFEEALKEADLDDMKQGLASAQKMNPINSLREAMDPLRQMGQDIKADLQKATKVDAPAAARVEETILPPAQQPVAHGSDGPTPVPPPVEPPVKMEKPKRKPVNSAVKKAPDDKKTVKKTAKKPQKGDS